MSVVLQTFSVLEQPGAVNSFAVTPPSSIVDGDLLLSLFGGDGTAEAVNDPMGNVILGAIQEPSGQLTTKISWKIAASESGNYTWTWTDSEDGCAWVIRIDGHNASTPINVDSGTGNTGSSVSAISPAVVTTVANCLVLYCFVSDGGFITTQDSNYPASTTGVFVRASDDATAGGSSVGLAYKTQVSAGNTGTATWTDVFSASQDWAGYTIAIAPAAAGGIAIPFMGANLGKDLFGGLIR